ncbi:MAG: gamma-glutamyl-gamma-aminobutyrate hydrolase family protein [Caldilineae bacterium]|nr:MAG: gamma-glutamyl-gamma-aminobutyrate hydrolase family protein [Caldilineae bacterium]
MSKQPIIGIPCRYDTSGTYRGRPINAQNQSYTRAIVQAGGVPFLIPLEVEEDALRLLYNLADGILLSGGGDVDPVHYHQPVDTTTHDVQAARDRVELTLTRWAAADGKPLLGICRGIQVMAVAMGGTLLQDIAAQKVEADRHDYYYRDDGHARNYLAHTVTLSPDCRLTRILGVESLPVNSLHHQAIDTLPPPCRVVGYAPDGVPEAIDLPGHPFFYGVQWHPEELVAEQEAARRLFAAFVDACRRD